MMSLKHLSMVLTLIAWTLSVSPLHSDEVPDAIWQQALGPALSQIPAPAFKKVVWRDDFNGALQEAEERNVPMFVTWRCIPCKQCSAFDKNVLEGSPLLTPLLKQFVTVRITDAGQLDERYFPYRGYQDLDLSWWGYFLSPKGRLYGVFGGKDHISDATRISELALVNTLRRVLDHHYDIRRSKWDIDGPIPDAAAAPVGPRDGDHFQAYADERPWVQKQNCVHCHQVRDLIHFEALKEGTFNMQTFTQPWPLPENVGIHLDRDDGLLVTKVTPNSPAQKAGIRPGDRLGMAGKRRLFGQADFRGVLHRASYDRDAIPVGWVRDDKAHVATLQVESGWRQAENAWRKSIYEGIYGPHLGFFPLVGPNHGKGSMSLRPFLGSNQNRSKNPWFKIGLRPNMEIVEVNGRSDDWDSRQFLAWFRLHHKVGDSVAIKVRNGKTFTYTIPAKH